MSQPLSNDTISLVKATVPALEAHGLDIVHEMYARMFQNPEIRDLFNQSHHGDAGSQPRALTGAILAYASNIENLGALAPWVDRLAPDRKSVVWVKRLSVRVDIGCRRFPKKQRKYHEQK